MFAAFPCALGPRRATAAGRRSAGACATSRATSASPSCYPFSPEVAKAVESLQPEFRAVDSLVACNSVRVLRAYQNARVGFHMAPKKSTEHAEMLEAMKAMNETMQAMTAAFTAMQSKQFEKESDRFMTQ